MDVMTLAATLTLNTSEFNTNLNSSEQKMKGLTTSGVALGNVMSTAVIAAGRALKKFGQQTVQVGMDFDAQMSQVKALGQLNDEQFIAIRQRAIDLGATTKFTATQVGEAFSYMALAGWDTEEMLAGISAMLDLASASGEDLGRTSDIVTDALTAFGLTASETEHFVDVLAAASANSNTTVGMMGEAFKYLAANAGVMKYSIDDVAIALGLLANNGIKSSQAGTSMRQVINSLIAPTNKAQEAMNKMGISLFEAGTDKVKPLRQVLTELRQAFKDADFDLEGRPIEEVQAKLDELDAWYDDWQEKLQSGNGFADYMGKQINTKDLDQMYEEKLREITNFNEVFLGGLKEIGGLRGISTLISLMKTTDEDFNQLVGAVEDSEGAASKMAETMIDNLQGDITLLKSAIESFQITISDSFNDELRQFIQALTVEIGKLNTAFQEGGLSGVLIEVGRTLLDIVTSESVWAGVFTTIKGILLSVVDKVLGTHYFENFQFEQKKDNIAKSAGYDNWDAYKTATEARRAEAVTKAEHGKPLYDLLVEKFIGEGKQGTAYQDISNYLQEIFGIAAKEANEYARKIYTSQYGEDPKTGAKITYTEGALENLQAALSDLMQQAIESQEAMASLQSAAESAGSALYSIPHFGEEGSFAKGQWNVPNDMSAILHRGEMVLTASQARKYREGEGMGGTTAIVSAIQGLRQDMQNLQLVVNGKTFGRASVQYGGDRMNGYIGKSERRAAAGHGW